MYLVYLHLKYMDQTVLIIGGYIENTTWASEGFVWFIVTLSMERNLKDVG